MSLQTTLPKEWKDMKIGDKILFVNTKEKLITFHPPMKLKNISIFLNIYQIKCKKEDILKKIEHFLSEEEVSKTNAYYNANNTQNITIAQNISKSLITSSSQLLQNQSAIGLVSNKLKVKESYDCSPITNPDKLKIIKGYWEENLNDLQAVLKKVVIEKYNTNPDFKYFSKLGEMFKCQIKIRQEFELCCGESDVSKIKAKEEAIKNGLKLLVPEIYKQMTNLEKSSNSECVPSNLSGNNINTFINSSENLTESKFLIDEIIDLNASSIVISPSESSEIDFNPPKKNAILAYPSQTPKESQRLYKERDTNNICDKTFLNKKRKNENLVTEQGDLGSKKKHGKNYDDIVETEEYVFGGCLKEDLYGNLEIDDPIVVDKYLKCSNYTPLSIINTFKAANPKVDFSEKVFFRNDGIKFEKFRNDNYTKIVMESQVLKIRVECACDNKKTAREYCAQKFLKVRQLFYLIFHLIWKQKLYQHKFKKWVDLVKYYEEKRYLKDSFL